MSEAALWYSKYRPKTLDEYVWTSPELKSRITNWISDPKSLPSLILEGPPGTGKTTLAMLLISELGLDTYDYLFINTNKHSGVEAIRETVTNFCETGGFSGLKLVVIDEADGLSIAAQDKLRGVINDYGNYVRFVFTCNKIRALSDALKSRARIFTLRALDMDEFISRLVYISQCENLISDDPSDEDLKALGQITECTYPDLRRAIDTLQDSMVIKSGVAQLKISNNDLVVKVSGWQQSIMKLLSNGGTPREIRELVTEMRKDEIEEAYRYMYESSGDLFTSAAKEQAAIVLIADYLKVHHTVAFPEINLAGLLNKLTMMQKMDDENE